MRDIEKIMEKHGIPGRDLGDLPDSPFTFPDGSHYRIEIRGVERRSAQQRPSTTARTLPKQKTSNGVWADT